MSLGTFEKYDEAQKAVDTLSDKEFPVENCLIVGTDLKQMERVTGAAHVGPRRRSAACSPACGSGCSSGLIFSLFARPSQRADRCCSPRRCLRCGLRPRLVARRLRLHPRRSVTSRSVSQVVATRYEVLVEHKFAQQGARSSPRPASPVSRSGFGRATACGCADRPQADSGRAAPAPACRPSRPLRAAWPRRQGAAGQAARGPDAGDPGLDVGGGARHRGREVLAAVVGDEDVVLDPHADAAELARAPSSSSALK